MPSSEASPTPRNPSPIHAEELPPSQPYTNLARGIVWADILADIAADIAAADNAAADIAASEGELRDAA